MKRKRNKSVKHKPKKLPAPANVFVDPQYYSDEIDSGMEILAREASSRKSSQHVSIDKPVVNNKTAGSAAAKLARIIDSSRAKATCDGVAGQQAPACKTQELDVALSVIKKVMKMNGAVPFNSPVDPIALGIPDYFDIIDIPMDFGTICSNLEKGLEYSYSEDVFKDVQRIWDSCCKYNKKGSPILEVMKRVKNNFMKQWTLAGLYKEQQTVSKGKLPHYPELYSDSTIRHEKPMHAFPVDSTMSSCAHLHRNDFSCMNKMQGQPLSPCCSGTFKPHLVSSQCPCSLHPSPLYHGHHQQGFAPQHNHHSHLHSVDHMNDSSCNQCLNKASPYLIHSYQPSPSFCVVGPPQHRTCLHQSSSSQLPPAQLQTCTNIQNAGLYASDKNHQQHQMGSVPVRAYQPSTNCMPAHHFSQNTSHQLHSSHTEDGRNIGFAGLYAGDKNQQRHQIGSVPVQAYKPSANCMPAHQFNQNTSHPSHSSHTEGGRDIGFAGRKSGDNNHQQHQMDSFHVQADVPFANNVPAHDFYQNSSQKLHTSHTEGGINSFADVPPPKGSGRNCTKRSSGCSRPSLTDNSSCQPPDQMKSTADQSSSMMNIGTCPPLQEPTPPEHLHSTSDNSFTKNETEGQGVGECQEQSSSIQRSQESEPEQNTCQTSSFLQSNFSPPITDYVMSKKRRRPHQGPKFIEGERISVPTNEKSQPFGPEAQKLIAFMGTLARNGYFLPLTYHDWRAVPSEYKENVWREIQLRFEIDPISQGWIMHSLAKSWRNWKSLLKTARYYPHKTNQERLADRDERVPPDQWAALIALWNTEGVEERSAKIRARRQNKINQVTGDKSSARVREEEQRQPHQGPKDKSTPQESNKQSDMLSEIIGPDKNDAKTVAEGNAEILDMKKKMTVMEQSCAQMASQMAAMMSMMSSMHRNAPENNVHHTMVNTSSASDQSLPQRAPAVPSPGVSLNRQVHRSKSKI